MKLKLFLFLIFIPILGFGQRMGKDREEKGERIQAAKVAYITSRLNLNTPQSQQFWPIYNEFEEARKKIKKQIKKLVLENANKEATDDQIRADIKKMFLLRQEELDLEKTYSEKFLKILTPKQLVDFYRAEKEFTSLLLKRLKGGRQGPGQGMEEERVD